MPRCAAIGCSIQSKNKPKSYPLIPFHWVPLEGEMGRKWLAAIGWPLSNLPKKHHLYSDHLEPHYFDESVDLRNRLMGGTQRDLKADAIPTIVGHKPAFKVRTTSRARAAKQKRQQVRGNVDFQSWNALLIRHDKVCLISGIIITALSPFCEFSNNNIGSSSYVHCYHMLKWKKFTVFLWYLSFLSGHSCKPAISSCWP